MLEQNPQFFDLNFWQNFVSNGLATLLGAFLGIFLAVLANSRQDKSTEKERKCKILSSLLSELKGDYDAVSHWINNNKSVEQAEYFGIYLNTEVWKSFSEGGELEWIKDPNLLFNLANTYHFLNMIKEISNDIRFIRNAKYITFTGIIYTKIMAHLDHSVDCFLDSVKKLEEFGLFVSSDH